MDYAEANIHALNAEAAAVAAQVQGMSAENKEREQQGKAPAWSDDSLCEKRVP